MTLEEHLQHLADLVTANRAVNWELDDQAAEMVREFGREVIGKIAEVCQCSRQRVRDLIAVSVTFPEDQRHPDVPWSVYLAAVRAAKRLEMPPQEVLELAMREELSAARVRRLGTKEPYVLRSTCGRCAARVVVETDASRGHMPVICPLCADDGERVVLGYVGPEPVPEEVRPC
ncbi:hypothetical protein [Caldinitratiruptor microaerophilus]|uniref:Uncharacterized protein n=1 Tax=Caldinitratiruptor microaerophilus TaxID=671077 RepID=A0AA35G9A8_9FIRM|nr:hypothetical protein [Caldinitratiruptor microaerophilus]BDG61911.1 hypothetical protein caldi_30010 [Caldinitratiruptor microaerophilus]